MIVRNINNRHVDIKQKWYTIIIINIILSVYVMKAIQSISMKHLYINYIMIIITLVNLTKFVRVSGSGEPHLHSLLASCGHSTFCMS